MQIWPVWEPLISWSPRPPKGEIALFNTGPINNSHFSSTMLDKFQRELSHLGYSFTMHRIHEDEVDASQLPLSFNTERTVGIICVELFDMEYASMLCELGTPILFVDSPVTGLGEPLKADCLYMENQNNIYNFVKEMARRGKRKIGFIGEYMYCQSFFERYMGDHGLFRRASPGVPDWGAFPAFPHYPYGDQPYIQGINGRLAQIMPHPPVFLPALSYLS